MVVHITFRLMKTAHTTKQTGTIGLDLGDRRHTVCALSDSGQILAEETLTNTHESLTGLSVRYPQATLVIKTGTHCEPRSP